MIDDEKIIDLFFERSEQGIRELDNKYGAVCHNLSYKFGTFHSKSIGERKQPNEAGTIRLP